MLQKLAKQYKHLSISYDGSDDSGWISDMVIEDNHTYEVFPSGPDRDALEDMAYRILSEFYGGWEINEGSSGSIELYLSQNRIELRHEWNVVQTEDDFNILTYGASTVS